MPEGTTVRAAKPTRMKAKASSGRHAAGTTLRRIDEDKSVSAPVTQLEHLVPVVVRGHVDRFHVRDRVHEMPQRFRVISHHDLDSMIARLRDKAARFRGDVAAGAGGRQILVEDPSGNVVELFERASPR